MLTRLTRLINVSIAVLALLLLTAAYWYAFRPLPKTSGKIQAPVHSAATIKRDARGVPHIEAASWQDAIFLEGYVTAQDRLWQMDGFRRFSAGNLSEVFGPSTIPADVRARRLRVRAIAEETAHRLSPEERALLEQYARGVNYYIDRHKGNYALEFSLPGRAYDPRHWTPVDSILVELMLFRDLTDGSRFEFDKGWLLAHSNMAKGRVLFPPVQGAMVSAGSNAWAVSGARTADGKPMLANDTHLAYSIPDIWYLADLKAPGLHVSGATVPGLPGIIIGHNEQIAWGMTNLEADCVDLYREQMDVRNGHYLFKGEVLQARMDKEVIPVKGAKPVTVNVWITRHGPIAIEDRGIIFSARWSAADGSGFPIFAVDRAQNWEQFRSALSGYWGPAQNFVYADRAGNIGYQAAGKVPVRRNFSGDVPLDGTSGRFEWDGYIPYEQMPMLYNPRSGMIATANQNPFPPDYPYFVDGNFADKYRILQIRALLTRKSKLTVEDNLAVEKDVYSAYDSFLARQVLKALAKHPSSDSSVVQAVPILQAWNGQMDKDAAAPLITQLIDRQVANALVASVLQPGIGTAHPAIRPRPQVIEDLLRVQPKGWVPNNDWDDWLIGQMRSALQEGRRLEGGRLSKWRWGRTSAWKFEHPVGKHLPLVSSFFDIGPIEMSGSDTTVKQTTPTLGPSERMVVDLGSLDNSRMNLRVGESGNVASGHYKDEWPAYYVGRSFPMEFEHVNAEDVLQVKPQ